MKTYDEAKEYIKSLNIKSAKEWSEYCKSDKKPKDIPYSPTTSYKHKGWRGWDDFLSLEKIEYFTYDEAREYVKALDIKTSKEWKKVIKSKSKSIDKRLPLSPNRFYKNKGWTGWTLFLSLKQSVRSKRNVLPFEEARAFIHSLNFKSWREWKEYCQSGNKPLEIPSAPNQAYKGKGWVNASDWLNVQLSDRNLEYLPFEEARRIVRELGLKNNTEWVSYCKSGQKPKNIPSHPNIKYKDEGFISMADFLGKELKGEYLPYSSARSFVNKLGLKTEKEWQKYCKSGNKPANIPSNPEEVYSKVRKWVSMEDWLIGKKTFRDYKESVKFVKTLKLKNVKEWVEYCKSGQKPKDIPSNPNIIYKDKGWISFSKWLGTDTVAFYNRNYRSYDEAKAFVHPLGIKNIKEWKKYCKSSKKPDDIPANPYNSYKNEPNFSFSDFLGTGVTPAFKRSFLPYDEAKTIVHQLGLRNMSEWAKYLRNKTLLNIPRQPDIYYKDKGWVDWTDWLGESCFKNSNQRFVSYEKAKAFVHSLNLSSYSKWREYIKENELPLEIPKYPYNVYANNGWVSWGDFLGTGNTFNVTKHEQYATYEEAKAYVHKLGLRNTTEWKEYVKEHTLPENIPTDPYRSYKNRGWIDWADFLNSNGVKYSNYKNAETFVRLLKLKSVEEWVAYSKSENKPNFIPYEPQRVYKNKGWENMEKWLGLE